MTPEQLITHLLDQKSKLEAQLSEAQQDIMDFEKAALIWKKGYSDMERKYRVKLQEADQIIKELEDEIEDLKEQRI